jgi:hypothetical protein
MAESDTYLMILDDGRALAIREILLLQGENQFGPPDPSVKAALGEITDVDRLLRIARRMLNATS